MIKLDGSFIETISGLIISKILHKNKIKGRIVVKNVEADDKGNSDLIHFNITLSGFINKKSLIGMLTEREKN